MAEYTIREEKRGAVEETIDGWLPLEGIQHLEVCRKRGANHSKIADSEVDAEELERLGCGEAVLDRVLDQIQGMGGRFELRLRFADYASKGGKSDLTKAFHLVRVKEPSTKSQGSSAATEQLATSLATAFDQQSARAESRDERHADFLSQMMMRQDESSERRLSEHASYQIEIMRLRDELARKDLEMALEQDPKDPNALHQLALHHVLQENNAEAMDLLIRLMQVDSKYKDEVAKTTLIELFDKLGNNNPDVRTYRRKLYTLMH